MIGQDGGVGGGGEANDDAHGLSTVHSISFRRLPTASAESLV